jgi:hypothetical protein
MRYVENLVETEGLHMTSQYGAYALHAGLTRLHARMRMHTPTRPITHTHAHTEQYVILIAFPRQQWFANEPQCYVILTFLLLFLLVRATCKWRWVLIMSGIKLIGKNWSTSRKPVTVPFCSPKISREISWYWTRPSTLRNRRVIAFCDVFIGFNTFHSTAHSTVIVSRRDIRTDVSDWVAVFPELGEWHRVSRSARASSCLQGLAVLLHIWRWWQKSFLLRLPRVFPLSNLYVAAVSCVLSHFTAWKTEMNVPRL